MAYSDWQLNRLRDALRAYHDHGGKRLSQKFNWNDVAEGIAEELGAKDPPVAAERLRQFVEGNRSKDGSMRKFGTLKPESLENVIAFAMKVNLLRPVEFEEREPSYHAAQRLLEYLDPKGERVRRVTSIIFEGRYSTRLVEKRVFRELDLTLHRPHEPGMMMVTMTTEVFDREMLDKIGGWDAEERRGNRKKRTVYAGWAIFTPEENMLVFLRESDADKNLHQFTLAADWYAPETEAERLFMLRHEYPIEMENTNREEEQVRRAILEETDKNLVIFRRLT